MATDNLQSQRLELKYIVPESIALGVRDFVRPLLEQDEFGVGSADYSYPIHSVYLDSERLALYWDTVAGNKNRFKLRVRFYDDNPDSPVFFEIKRRMNEAILKQRARAPRELVPELLAGHLPPMTHPDCCHPKNVSALENFSRLMLNTNARPVAQVSYRREAWVSPHNNSVRVTMDRQVMVDMNPNADLLIALDRPVLPFGKNVILELKFTGRHPNWFGDLVRCFNLWRSGAAKYAGGLMLMQESGRDIHPRPALDPALTPENAPDWQAAPDDLEERSKPVSA